MQGKISGSISLLKYAGNCRSRRQWFALCAFLFDVRSNRGFHRWVNEPVVENKEPRLAWRDEDEWAKLDEQAIRRLVDRVVVWYDALAVRLRAS